MTKLTSSVLWLDFAFMKPNYFISLCNTSCKIFFLVFSEKNCFQCVFKCVSLLTMSYSCK